MWKELQVEVDQLPEAGPETGQLFAAGGGLHRQPARGPGKPVAKMLLTIYLTLYVFKIAYQNLIAYTGGHRLRPSYQGEPTTRSRTTGTRASRRGSGRWGSIRAPTSRYLSRSLLFRRISGRNRHFIPSPWQLSSNWAAAAAALSPLTTSSCSARISVSFPRKPFTATAIALVTWAMWWQVRSWWTGLQIASGNQDMTRACCMISLQRSAE